MGAVRPPQRQQIGIFNPLREFETPVDEEVVNHQISKAVKGNPTADPQARSQILVNHPR